MTEASHEIRAILDLFRAFAQGDEATIETAASRLNNRPGRAAGRVTAWSVRRASDMLQRGARRPVRFGAPGAAPTAHECSILEVLFALARGETEAARRHAQWLVRGDTVDRFVERLSPAAESLPAHALAA